MEQYKKEITKLYSPLSRKEQKDLYRKMQEGESQARDQVINSCLPLVIELANKFRTNNKHVPLEDLIQEGNVALLNAVNRWDGNANSISTVVYTYVRNAMIDMIHDARYNVTSGLTYSRRASEEMNKIRACNTRDVDKIHEQTGISKKRIRKLQSNSNGARFNLEYLNEIPIETDTSTKYCIADVIHAISTMTGIHKNIFSQWCGIDQERKGSRRISKEMNMPIQDVNKIIKESKQMVRETLNA